MNEFGVFTIFLVYTAIMICLFLSVYQSNRDDEAVAAAAAVANNITTVEQDQQNELSLQAFSKSYKYDAGNDSTNSKVQRRREVRNDLLGPLVPVDCNVNRRVCVTSENCQLFCKDATIVNFQCSNNGVCVEAPITASSSSDNSDYAVCDTRGGEYGLLVGYNELGVAQWDCVQLYPGWQDRTQYCEKGIIDMDARVRAPTYSDCLCPPKTVRMVYNKSILGQTVYGLPHCVPNNLEKFYQLNYRKI